MGKRVLQLGLLVELVQDDVAGLALLQLHHHADAFPVALVPQVGDAVDLLLVHQLGDLLQQGGLVHLVGQLGEDDLLPVPGPLDLLHVGLGPHHAAAAAGAVGVQDALGAQHEAAAGEIRALDVGHDARPGPGRVVDQGDQGAAALPQVVGRDAGGHAHGDALAAVHQQVGEPGGQDEGLLHAVVVVGAQVHRVLVEVGHHLVGQAGQPGLGVAHGRRGCRRRWSRSCPGRPPAHGAWRRAGPCAPGCRRWPSRRGDGTCP